MSEERTVTESYQQDTPQPPPPAGPPIAPGAPRMWTPPSYASAAPGAPEGHGDPNGWSQPSYGEPHGYGYPYGYAPARPAVDRGARNALILAIVAFFCFGVVLGPVAVFQGVTARGRIRVSQGRLTGDGLALAAIILGSLATIGAVFGMIYFFGNMPKVRTR
jgi:hypothetical protein